MVDINSYYTSASNTLKAAELPPNTEVPVIISKIEEGEFKDGDKVTKKLIIRFQGKDKGLALNKTNATTIAAAYGPETNEWINKKIFLYSTKVDFSGSMVDAIRVRADLAQASMDDDIPF